jgi:hypothetical protein
LKKELPLDTKLQATQYTTKQYNTHPPSPKLKGVKELNNEQKITHKKSDSKTDFSCSIEQAIQMLQVMKEKGINANGFHFTISN